jgi:hypothetical protein
MYSCVETRRTVVEWENQGECEDREEEERGGGEEDTKANIPGREGDRGKENNPSPQEGGPGAGAAHREKRLLARRKAIASGPRPLRSPIFIQSYASYP